MTAARPTGHHHGRPRGRSVWSRTDGTSSTDPTTASSSATWLRRRVPTASSCPRRWPGRPRARAGERTLLVSTGLARLARRWWCGLPSQLPRGLVDASVTAALIRW